MSWKGPFMHGMFRTTSTQNEKNVTKSKESKGAQLYETRPVLWGEDGQSPAVVLYKPFWQIFLWRRGRFSDIVPWRVTGCVLPTFFLFKGSGSRRVYVITHLVCDDRGYGSSSIFPREACVLQPVEGVHWRKFWKQCEVKCSAGFIHREGKKFYEIMNLQM